MVECKQVGYNRAMPRTTEWVGFDLDGTLAHYDEWVDHVSIGEPVPRMVSLLKKYLARGMEVRIFTARGTEWRPSDPRFKETMNAIEIWCEHHIGQKLPITSAKDLNCVALYDDHAYGVITNTGIVRL
jgi:FMN phosphatase YigB (HAD superfamily)